MFEAIFVSISGNPSQEGQFSLGCCYQTVVLENYSYLLKHLCKELNSVSLLGVSVSFMLSFLKPAIYTELVSFHHTLFEPVWFSLTPVSSFPPPLRFLPFTLFHLSPLHRPEAVASTLETGDGLSLRYSPQPLPHYSPQTPSNVESPVHSANGLHELKLQDIL